MSEHPNCPTCRCAKYEPYDGWADLQQHYSGVRTLNQLRVAVREEYRLEHPRKWARCTSDEAVESSIKAFGPYLNDLRNPEPKREPK